MPILRIASAASSGPGRIRTASASSKSALPQWLEIDRLPCLATRTPAPAVTNAAIVEMLNVHAPSPPVPQVSSSGSPLSATSTRCDFSRMARAKPVSSAAVSPFIRNATRNAATCAVVASPDKMASMASRASPALRSSRAATR